MEKNPEKIPHVLHYCWFGRKPKPKFVIQCMLSWRKYLPDWEIKEWNEENFDIYQSKYTLEAYQAGKFAFVADYVRFYVLCKYGGVYIDTDVEFLKPIPDAILKHQAFSGVESTNQVAPGLIFGAVKNHPFVQEMVTLYDTHHFQGANNLNETIVTYTTKVLQKHGYQINGTYQVVDEVAVYPCDVFCGYNLGLHEVEVTPNTISVHHYAASWVPYKTKLKLFLLRILKKVVGRKCYCHFKILKRKLINKDMG